MPKLPLFALLLLCSCVTSRSSVSSRRLSSVEPISAALFEDAALVEAHGFSESLLHFGINDTPLSLVLGYSAAEPTYVQNEVSDVSRDHRAEARPSLGFSVSF